MSPVQGKYDFLWEMYDGIETNKTCVEYTDARKLTASELQKLATSMIDCSEKEDKPEYWIMHSPSTLGRNLGRYDIFEDNYGNYSFWVNQVVASESDMNECLEFFNKDIVEPLETAKYLLLVTDKLLVMPKIKITQSEWGEFGYVLSHVDVYDINTTKMVDSFDVAARNSDELFFFTETINEESCKIEAIDNLYKRLKNNIITSMEVVERSL